MADDYLRNLRDGKLGDDYFFFREYNDWKWSFAGKTCVPYEFERKMESMFEDVRKMLATRDKIIKEFLDKEKLYKLFKLLPFPEIKTAVFIFLRPLNFTI